MKSLEHAFFEFIYKRHLIWYKRFVLKQEPPWTLDPILQKYKVINMYRELDACTRYLHDKLKDVKNREKFLLNTAFYRFFNRRRLYESLGIGLLDTLDDTIKAKILQACDRLQKDGKPIFNDAYLISSGEKGTKKHYSILDNLQATDFHALVREIDQSKTPEASLKVIQTIPMVGPFLACEIWTDLSYNNFFPQGWTDNDFVNIGPGAQWGLEIVFALSKPSSSELHEKLAYLHKLQETRLPEVHRELGESLSWKEIAYTGASSHYPFLSLTNLEGALCEFRKYWNLRNGRGKRRYFRTTELCSGS